MNVPTICGHIFFMAVNRSVLNTTPGCSLSMGWALSHLGKGWQAKTTTSCRNACM